LALAFTTKRGLLPAESKTQMGEVRQREAQEEPLINMMMMMIRGAACWDRQPESAQAKWFQLLPPAGSQTPSTARSS